jgi:carbamoyltransferase
MGLAPYGEPVYVQKILDNLIDLREDGSLRLDMKYFNFAQGLTMTSRAFDELFGGAPRQPEAPLTQREMDLARSVQEVTERAMLRMARHVHKETGEKNLCLAGGVALNCVGNGRILRETEFENVWIQPAAGDAGGAIGAALSVWYQYLDNPRVVDEVYKESADGMKGAYLGNSFSSAEVKTALDQLGATYKKLNRSDLSKKVAGLLAAGKVVGWFQGRMEFGPRALGSRSILGDPRSNEMQSQLNLKIKFRESFRPFAPAILREKLGEYFEIERDSPYMLLVAPVRQDKRIAVMENGAKGIEKLKIRRSQIPAVTHVDYSARIQSVARTENPIFYDLIREFDELTGCPVLINTSFNVRGEPIVCTPEQAFNCFVRTGMDYLVIEDFLLDKTEQPENLKISDDSWQHEFPLD